MFAGPERVHRAIPIDRVTSASTPLDSPCLDLRVGQVWLRPPAPPGSEYAYMCLNHASDVQAAPGGLHSARRGSP